MQPEIKVTEKEVCLTYPRKRKRFNPYTDDYSGLEYETFVGLHTVDKHGHEEFGLAFVIDMDYKGKSDQWTDIVIHMFSLEELNGICYTLGVPVIKQDSGFVD